VSLGGPLTDPSQYVELATYDSEMPENFDDTWSWRQKHQFYLERFCAAVLRATADRGNVLYEIFNEGEWYDQQHLRDFQQHFVDFIARRTSRLVLVNDDHLRFRIARSNPRVHVISLHRPMWKVDSDAETSFEHYSNGFFMQPMKPHFFTEPVPAFDGNPEDLPALMRLIWGTALGGAGVVVQNDASFGFDPRTTMARHALARDDLLDLEGHAARFFNRSGVRFASMAPDPKVASTGVALAKRGFEYVVYMDGGAQIELDLREARGTLRGRFYDPRDGTFRPAFDVEGGHRKVPIASPDGRDWVLHLVAPRTLERVPGRP
jgi:hypothetical protein